MSCLSDTLLCHYDDSFVCFFFFKKKNLVVISIVMRLSFCLCKHILNITLESKDDHAIELPFTCFVMKIILQSKLDISGEPKVKIQDPLGNQTLMKSNA